MKLSDRIAERLMAALPTSRIGMIAVTAFGVAAVFFGMIYLFGAPLTAVILLVGAGSAWFALPCERWKWL